MSFGRSRVCALGQTGRPGCDLFLFLCRVSVACIVPARRVSRVVAVCFFEFWCRGGGGVYWLVIVFVVTYHMDSFLTGRRIKYTEYFLFLLYVRVSVIYTPVFTVFADQGGGGRGSCGAKSRFGVTESRPKTQQVDSVNAAHAIAPARCRRSSDGFRGGRRGGGILWQWPAFIATCLIPVLRRFSVFHRYFFVSFL